jgi:hypothetical protein
MSWLPKSRQAFPQYDRFCKIRGSHPFCPDGCRFVDNMHGHGFLESSMKVFIFLTGSLVGAYYNTAVLTVASACAGACTKGANLILQLIA